MKKIKKIILILLVWLLFVGFYQATKKLPESFDFRGEERDKHAENIQFLYDLTYKNFNGQIISEQTIFDEVFSLIEGAKEYILVDAFLFNSYSALFCPVILQAISKTIPTNDIIVTW